jgi:hypothetical protein
VLRAVKVAFRSAVVSLLLVLSKTHSLCGERRLSANGETVGVFSGPLFSGLFQGKNLHASSLFPATTYKATEVAPGSFFQLQGVAKTATTPSQLDIFLTGECKRGNADSTLVLPRNP